MNTFVMIGICGMLPGEQSPDPFAKTSSSNHSMGLFCSGVMLKHFGVPVFCNALWNNFTPTSS